MASVPKTTRFLADASVYSPTGRRTIQINLDETGLDAAAGAPALAPGRSFLEFTVTPSTAESWPATQLRLTEAGALAFIRNIRVMSRQSSVVLDEVQSFNLLWSELFRTGYNDAQRDTLARFIGAQYASEPRSIFNTLPVTAANAGTVAPFTCRIPLPCLQGIFKSPSIPLGMTKGLTLQIDLEDRIPACLVRAPVIYVPPVERPSLAVGANDKSGGGGTPSPTLVMAAGVTPLGVIGAFVGYTHARVVTWNASAAAILIEDVAYTSVNDANPPTITFGADVGGTANIVGGIVEPRAATGQYTLSAVGAGTTVTTALDVVPAATTIPNGSYVLITLNAVSTDATPVVTTTKAYRKVTAVAPSGSKLQFTLDTAVTAASGGGTISLVHSPTGGPDPGNSTYTISDPAIIAASEPLPKLPKQLSWVSWATWAQQMSSGSSTLQWPTLPYGRALAAVCRMYTSHATASTGTGNSLTDYLYFLNGEATVEGGPVPLASHSPLFRAELQAALDTADAPVSRFSTVADALAVALQAPGAAPTDTTASVIQLQVNGATSAATAALFVAHLRTLLLRGGTPVVVFG